MGLTLALLCSTLLGCIITLCTQTVMSDTLRGSQNDQAKAKLLLTPAPWRTGDWWIYSVSGSSVGETSIVQAIVSNTDGGDYTLGTTSQHEARKYAVLDTFPFLGRISYEDRSVYADGRPQKLLPFPLSADTIFGFSLFEQEWSAVVSSASRRTGTAQMFARGSSGDRLTYSYSFSKGYIDQFIWTRASGDVALNVEMIEHGTAYRGESWCVFSESLFDSEWKETLQGAVSTEQTSSFDVGDEIHQMRNEWDHLLVKLSVKTGIDGVALLSIAPSDGEATVQHRFGHEVEVLKDFLTVQKPKKKYIVSYLSEGESALELHVSKATTKHWTLM